MPFNIRCLSVAAAWVLLYFVSIGNIDGCIELSRDDNREYRVPGVLQLLQIRRE